MEKSEHGDESRPESAQGLDPKALRNLRKVADNAWSIAKELANGGTVVIRCQDGTEKEFEFPRMDLEALERTYELARREPTKEI